MGGMGATAAGVAVGCGEAGVAATCSSDFEQLTLKARQNADAVSSAIQPANHRSWSTAAIFVSERNIEIKSARDRRPVFSSNTINACASLSPAS